MNVSARRRNARPSHTSGALTRSRLSPGGLDSICILGVLIHSAVALQPDTVNGDPSPPNRSRQTLWIAVGLVLSVLCLLLAFRRTREPSYGGRTLTQWLMNTNPDAIWMPNDFYGHIHDEFWERLVAEDSTTNHADSEQPAAEDVATNLTDTDAQNVDPAAAEITTAVRQIGTNGLPD